MGLTLFEQRPSLKDCLLREFADPKMNHVKMARKHRVNRSTIREWSDKLGVRSALAGVERRRVFFLQLGVYKMTAEKIAVVRKLGSNPQNTAEKICKIARINPTTLRAWRRRFRIAIASMQKRQKNHRQKVARFRAAAQIKGMTLQRLLSRFRFGRPSIMKKFAKNAGVKISHIRPEPPKAKKLCKRCHRRPRRARGYCSSCFEWARREGKIDNGRRCRKCRRFCYGNSPKCWRHLHPRKPGRPAKYAMHLK